MIPHMIIFNPWIFRKSTSIEQLKSGHYLLRLSILYLCKVYTTFHLILSRTEVRYIKPTVFDNKTRSGRNCCFVDSKQIEIRILLKVSSCHFCNLRGLDTVDRFSYKKDDFSFLHTRSLSEKRVFSQRKECIKGQILEIFFLTLKAPRKTASENVICLCRLLNILANFFKPIFAYRQTVWTQIRLLLKEQSDLGPHCLQK